MDMDQLIAVTVGLLYVEEFPLSVQEVDIETGRSIADLRNKR